MAAPNMDLTGRCAAVSGGGGGIGGATSRQLAAAGAKVLLCDVDAELAAATEADIRADGGEVRVLVGDIRDPAVVEEFCSSALDLGGGRLDVLVNNVGDFRPAMRDFLRTDEDQWQALYELNLLHVIRCTHRLLPSMVENRSGSIVNVSTVEAFRGIPGHSVYSAFNAGVVAFTKSIAVEYGKHGIRANAIAPDLADTLQTPADQMLRGRDPELISSWLPLGRFGDPVDYADVIVFLASDASRFVTGHTVPVDGGTLAASGWYGRADGKGFTNLPDHA